MAKEKHVPENAIFCCFGCMSSVGTLTGVAILEAYRKLDKEKNGLFCASAIAAGVQKHRKTTERAKRIIVVDGCYNQCAKKILEKDGLKADAYLNLLEDLVGICSLPALANQIKRQVLMVKNLKHRIVIDGCHNSCARNLAEKMSLPYDAYINLENDLMIEKMGPFSTLRYSDDDVKMAKEAIKAQVGQLRDEI